MKATYIKNGENPPLAINFMGKQIFTLNQPTTVTDPEVQAKLRGHPSFRVEEEEVEEAEFREVSRESNNTANRKPGRPKTRQTPDRSESEVGVERGSDASV